MEEQQEGVQAGRAEVVSREWNVSVSGVGPHGNDGFLSDIENLALEFVTYLRHEGHRIDGAVLTVVHGGEKRAQAIEAGLEQVGDQSSGDAGGST